MWTAMLALSLLVAPAFYAMTIIVVWASVPRRGVRLAIVSGMILVPLWFAGHAAVKAREMMAAEESFKEACRLHPGPEIRAQATNVEAVFVNIPTLGSNATPAARHPQSVLSPEVATRFLLQGAVRYTKIERIAGWGPIQTIDPRNSGRPQESRASSSRYAIEWRSIRASAPYVTTGTMTILDTATGQILGEQLTHYLDSPPVTIYGGDAFGFRLFPARKVACPTAHKLVHFVKSVARPAAAPGT